VKATKRILPVIVISQFLCTSLWFAGNAILPDLVKTLNLQVGLLAHLTSAVQFGFITGTLLFAILTISDRFSPSLVFFICSVIAALTNLVILTPNIDTAELLVCRYLTGFFLAGIYPVGMKIAADHFQKGLGRSLGFLVGALVLGTAFPHLVKSMTADLSWKYVLISTSGLSIFGGLAIFIFVPDGPYHQGAQKLRVRAFLKVFHNKSFRSASLGYFGHMWELYTFWAFVPNMLAAYNLNLKQAPLNVPFLSFIIMASGAAACVISGLLSEYFAAKRIAAICLFLSGLCCILSPVFLYSNSPFALIAFLIFWGLVVIADSPLFSTLVARNASPEWRGTSLTLVNCIGFSITILSIQFINMMSSYLGSQYVYMLLAIGPIAGLLALVNGRPEFSRSASVETVL
jgi:MFS family permease